jgi:hypothetical protein
MQSNNGENGAKNGAAAAEIATVALHAAAPPKPAPGAPCNGCGVCCAIAPCPLSRTLLGHRSGSCPALSWQVAEARYGCGLVMAPAHHLRWLPPVLAPLARRLARRWVAVGIGCDCDADANE